MAESLLPLKKILCIRADNMGDLLMSSPAIRALKETFNAHITVLTSSASKGVVEYLPEIDEAIIYDLPWVKTNALPDIEGFNTLVSDVNSRGFDAAVIFTVYSQNPLPAAMVAYLAGIPVRAAFCRENPYHLLTHWIPDPEPYTFIRHQVKRDLALVAELGASTQNNSLSITVPEGLQESLKQKLTGKGIDFEKPWLMLHPGVSEKKREFPAELWIAAGRELSKSFQLLFTGNPSERALTEYFSQEIGEKAFSLGGELSLDEFIALIKTAPLVVSVNTGTIHLAAALQTPVIVLYALTNPQHLPWKVKGKALFFNVPKEQRSRNEVIRFVNDTWFVEPVKQVTPDAIVEAVFEILSNPDYPVFPEMVEIQSRVQEAK